jgi:hypothetical protein
MCFSLYVCHNQVLNLFIQIVLIQMMVIILDENIALSEVGT